VHFSTTEVTQQRWEFYFAFVLLIGFACVLWSEHADNWLRSTIKNNSQMKNTTLKAK
jgi:hypothetical protein